MNIKKKILFVCIIVITICTIPKLIYASTISSSYTQGSYIINSKFDNSTIKNAIDVSSHQGEIDWEAVKADGIEIAFIRVGYRGFLTGNLAVDSYAIKNLVNANAAGIKIGAYIF